MTKLRKLGKPPYLRPLNLENDDLINILEPPYIKDGQYGDRGYAVSKLERTGEVFTVPFNTTSWDGLMEAWGEDSQMWLNKKAKARLEKTTIRGEQKQVVFWEPYVEPQKNLA